MPRRNSFSAHPLSSKAAQTALIGWNLVVEVVADDVQAEDRGSSLPSPRRAPFLSLPLSSLAPPQFTADGNGLLDALTDAAERVEDDPTAITEHSCFDPAYGALVHFGRTGPAERARAAEVVLAGLAGAVKGCKRALSAFPSDAELAEVRETLKKTAFLASRLVQEAEKATASGQAGAASTARGRGKQPPKKSAKVAKGVAELDWAEVREAVVVQLLESAELDLCALWGHRAPDEALVHLYTAAATAVLEQPAALKGSSAALREALWRLLSLAAVRYGGEVGFVGAVVSLVLGYEHLPHHLAELMRHLLDEHQEPKPCPSDSRPSPPPPARPRGPSAAPAPRVSDLTPRSVPPRGSLPRRARALLRGALTSVGPSPPAPHRLLGAPPGGEAGRGARAGGDGAFAAGAHSRASRGPGRGEGLGGDTRDRESALASGSSRGWDRGAQHGWPSLGGHACIPTASRLHLGYTSGTSPQDMGVDSAAPKNVAAFLVALAARAPLMLLANAELLLDVRRPCHTRREAAAHARDASMTRPAGPRLGRVHSALRRRLRLWPAPDRSRCDADASPAGGCGRSLRPHRLGGGAAARHVVLRPREGACDALASLRVARAADGPLRPCRAPRPRAAGRQERERAARGAAAVRQAARVQPVLRDAPPRGAGRAARGTLRADARRLADALRRAVRCPAPAARQTSAASSCTAPRAPRGGGGAL